jgi:ParB family transcriptional regulator, chromosome partitioning protein
MAKRRRLTSMPFLAEAPAPATVGTPFPPKRPPIAEVAGEAAATAALEEMAGRFERARAEGRMIQSLPLDAVQSDYLVRDRLGVEDEAQEALIASIRARGQQVPVEVVELGPGRYGLISGWRRLAALRALFAETGDPAFATVLAILRRPAEASDAYVAMVEENELRVGLSYYERARIVARAVEAGVFPDRTEALRGLFATASRARRSKIGSFLALYAALDGALRFPQAIPERLGLKLAAALDTDPTLGPRIRAELETMPAPTPRGRSRAADPPRHPAPGSPQDQGPPPGRRGAARRPRHPAHRHLRARTRPHHPDRPRHHIDPGPPPAHLARRGAIAFRARNARPVDRRRGTAICYLVVSRGAPMSVKASISLTEAQQAYARRLVAEGRYPSLSAVLQHGLELLREQSQTSDALRELLARRQAGEFVSLDEGEQVTQKMIADKRAGRGL